MIIKFTNYIDQACPYCNQILKTTASFSRHIKRCHSNSDSEWYKNHQKICPKC